MGSRKRESDPRRYFDNSGCRSLGGKTMDWLQMDELHSEGLDYPPSPKGGSKGHRRSAKQHDPERDVEDGQFIITHQGKGYDTHRFLGIVIAMAESHVCRRRYLQSLKERIYDRGG